MKQKWRGQINKHLSFPIHWLLDKIEQIMKKTINLYRMKDDIY